MTEVSGEFRAVLAESVGEENAVKAIEAFSVDPSVSVRLNPFRHGQTPVILECATPVPWSEHGYLLATRPSFTADPLFHAGVYYVQDSSAMYVGYMARQLFPSLDRTVRVLDLCAAPGGKTTDIAASLREKYGDGFVLVANEVMRQRSLVLAENVARWGDPNVLVTSVDPSAFAALEGFFDMIVADVPCSGEGMFRKDEDAVRMWSAGNVALCEARQRRIMADVWPALKPGGILVYSTCTFNKKEDDGNVEWIAEKLGAEIIDLDIPFEGVLKNRHGALLLPGLVKGEGQYCAALRKIGGEEYRPLKLRGHSKAEKGFPGMFDCGMSFRSKDGLFTAVPEKILPEADALGSLRPLMTGTAVGEMKGGKLVPHADLALSIFLDDKAFPSVEVDLPTALHYLHGDQLSLHGQEKGVILIKYKGYSLGFVNNLGARCNNLLPKGRRIRMNISI